MNHNTRVKHRPLRAGSSTARAAAAVTAFAGLALLAAACGGSRRPPVPTAREYGRVDDLPVGGRLLVLHALPRGAELPRPRQQRTTPQARRAPPRGQQLPAAVGPASLPAPAPEHRRGDQRRLDLTVHDGRRLPQALVQHVLTEERSFAGCMRSHGVPSWPDPIIDSQGRPAFAISISKDGFNPYSKPIWAKGNECSHLMPDLPGAPSRSRRERRSSVGDRQRCRVRRVRRRYVASASGPAPVGDRCRCAGVGVDCRGRCRRDWSRIRQRRG